MILQGGCVYIIYYAQFIGKFVHSNDMPPVLVSAAGRARNWPRGRRKRDLGENEQNKLIIATREGGFCVT
jgi:hypothetical protein